MKECHVKVDVDLSPNARLTVGSLEPGTAFSYRGELFIKIRDLDPKTDGYVSHPADFSHALQVSTWSHFTFNMDSRDISLVAGVRMTDR